MHEHDVHAEGLIRQLAAAADAVPEHLRGHTAGTDQAQGSGVGDRSGKLGGGDVGHTALNKGKLNAQKLV